jgi:hypothetical protein
MKIEATCSSETLVNFYQPAWLHIPEAAALHNHGSENLVFITRKQ